MELAMQRLAFGAVLGRVRSAVGLCVTCSHAGQQTGIVLVARVGIVEAGK